jgi:hypothetical protein
MAKFGNAAILWTSTEDANTSRVFLLDQPLVEVTPHHNQAVYRRESLDRSAVETYSVGNGAYELTGTIRYSADPDGLIEMLKAGSQGKTLTYIPNLNDSALYNAVILMDPMSPTQAALDAQRAGYGEHQVSVRFRKTDESPFTGQVKGTDVIFAYRAGGSLKHGVATATFARVTSTSAPASYASISSGDYGFGTVSTAATNKARVSWMANPTSVGPRTFPTLLLEPARTNRLPYSEAFASTVAWSRSGSPSLTTGQADPKGGTAAVLLSDNLTTAQSFIRSTDIALTSTFAVLSLSAKQGTTVNTATVQLISATGGATRISFNVSWSSGVPSIAYANGVAAAPMERFRAGWWRIAARSTSAVSALNYAVRLYPAGVASTARGNIYLYGVQVEQ